MPTVPIRSPSKRNGVIWDTPAHDLPPNAWSSGVNARLYKNRIERLGGPLTVDTVVDGRALFEIKVGGQAGLLRVTATAIEISFDGVSWVDRTPLAGYVDSPEWQLDQYGSWIILVAPNQDPWVLSDSDVEFKNFTNWQAGYRVTRIFPYKQFLIAIGVDISGQIKDGLFKWSDEVDPDSLTTVEWDHTVTTNLAGEKTIPAGDGAILDGGVLRDSAILYTDRAVWRLDFTTAVINGVAVVFNDRQLFGDDGILRSRCWHEIEGQHMVVGKYNLYVHDGHHRQDIGNNRATEEFFEKLGDNNFAFLTHFQEKQEVQLWYAQGEKNYASSAFIFSYLYNAWSSEILVSDIDGGNTGFVSHVARGPQSATSSLTYDSVVGTYDDFPNTSYNSTFANSRALELYVMAPDKGRIYVLDRFDESDFLPEMVLERVDLDFDEVFGNARALKYIDSVYPQVTGNGQLLFQFGGRNSLEAGIQWQPEVPFNIGLDYKVDQRITWRYPCFRLRQVDNGQSGLTGVDISVQQSHGR